MHATEHPLRVDLSPISDGDSWTLSFGPDEARMGYVASGEHAFARRLCATFGDPLPDAPPGERVARYALALADHDDGDRTYSAAREADPQGVARYMLRLRDDLRRAGWDGRTLLGSERLAELATIERRAPDLPPGAADAVHRALAALPAKVPPLSVTLLAPEDHYATVVRTLCTRLRAAGAEVKPRETARVLGFTDLARVASEAGRSELRGDGSLVRLEAETPWEAALVAAAWMRDHDGSRALIAPTEVDVLDLALGRAGLPRLAPSNPSRWRPSLQVLPLRLAMLFTPRDPAAAAELLSLPTGPLRRASYHLHRALQQMPGIGGPDWIGAITSAREDAIKRTVEGFLKDGLDEAMARELAAPAGDAAAGDIERWFGGPVHDAYDGVPADVAAAVCDDVARWAQGSARVGRTEPDPVLAVAGSVASALARMLRLSGTAKVPRLALFALHDLAIGRGVDRPDRVPEAGRPALVELPGSLSAPAAEVLWWGFIGGAGIAATFEPWTRAERDAVRHAGVTLPPPGQARAVEAWGFRQAVRSARERLVLVRWRTAGRDSTLPHPFEDELHARFGDLARITVTAEQALSGSSDWRPVGDPLPALSAIRPRKLWRLPARSIDPRTPLSPTQIEHLLACPLKWYLGDRLKWRRPNVTRLPNGPRLLGLFAHRLLDEVLGAWRAEHPDEPVPAEHVREAIGLAFDRRVDTEAAPLARAGARLERDAMRRRIVDAAGGLARALAAGSWLVEGSEVAVSGGFARLPWQGRADLVVRRADGARAVIDFKTGRLGDRIDQLKRGSTWQLALYATAVRGALGAPPIAMFGLRDAQLASNDPAAFPDAIPAEGPAADEVVGHAQQIWRDWWQGLDRGLVAATATRAQAGLAEDWQDAVGAALPGFEAPPCDYCDLRVLCHTTVTS